MVVEFEGYMGEDENKFRCVLCGKREDVLYFCKCSKNCCVRVCRYCRDKRLHYFRLIEHLVERFDKVEIEKRVR